MRFLPFLFLFIAFGCGTQKIADYKADGVKVDDTAGDGGLDSLIGPYRDSMEVQMDEVIGKANFALEKNSPESPLSNFAAEAAFLEGLKIGQNTRALGPNIMKRSFALLNFGGLRAPVSKGEITLGDLYELMPFDNTLVLLKLSPEKVRQMCTYLYNSDGQPVFNVTFKLTVEGHEVSIGGEPYNFDQDVVVITSDYLADGGDKMDFLKNPMLKYDSGKFLRDVFIDYVKEKKELGEYKTTGKFEIIHE